MLALLSALKAEVDPVVACPAGPVRETFRAMGLPVIPITGTSGSLKFNLRRTSRALREFGSTAIEVGKAARATQADIVHANSIRAGLVSLLAGCTGAPRPLVHVRDCLPDTLPARAVRKLILKGARVIIANSGYTAARFAPDHPLRVRVIPSPVDPKQFDPNAISRATARQHLGLDPEIALLGMVAQITPWKAQDDAVRALALLQRRPEAILLLVGEPKFVSPSTRLDNLSYSRELDALAATLRVADRVVRLGEREDIPEILAALDLLLLPSHEEPFGRAVVEGMAMRRTVIATSVGGPAEIIHDGVDGFLLEPRDPARWASTIDELLDDPALTKRVGRRAAEVAHDRFAPDVIADQMLAAYQEAAGNL